jgi:predicted nucleotidyltransferase
MDHSTATAPTLAQLAARRAEILKLAAARRAHNVRVFGSVARGEADERSDIDFLVDLEPDATLFDLSGLILDLEEALGRKVNVIEIRKNLSPVSTRILSEAVPL